jgi:hypothetical protein
MYTLLLPNKSGGTDICLSHHSPRLPGDNSEREPPESIPNSVVKTLSADDSAGSPCVKVGHCQAYI